MFVSAWALAWMYLSVNLIHLMFLTRLLVVWTQSRPKPFAINWSNSWIKRVVMEKFKIVSTLATLRSLFLFQVKPYNLTVVSFTTAPNHSTFIHRRNEDRSFLIYSSPCIWFDHICVEWILRTNIQYLLLIKRCYTIFTQKV